MEAMGVFGLFAFCMVLILMDKVKRLERILRDNNIRPGGWVEPGEQVRKQVGRTVTLTLETDDWDFAGRTCRILDVDETWVLVRINEGKKSEREQLVRLDSVGQIKVK